MNEEKSAIDELKSMNPGELDLVQYEYVWWVCCCKGCNNAHRVRDYGIAPVYWSKRWGFLNVDEKTFWCGKHWKYYQRLVPKYGIDKVGDRFVDQHKNWIMTDEEKIQTKNQRVKQKVSQTIHQKPKRK